MMKQPVCSGSEWSIANANSASLFICVEMKIMSSYSHLWNETKTDMIIVDENTSRCDTRSRFDKIKQETGSSFIFMILYCTVFWGSREYNITMINHLFKLVSLYIRRKMKQNLRTKLEEIVGNHRLLRLGKVEVSDCFEFVKGKILRRQFFTSILS